MVKKAEHSLHTLADQALRANGLTAAFSRPASIVALQADGLWSRHAAPSTGLGLQLSQTC